ncbi:MAG: tRNA (adenosine(37)-N6)-threonylcarbamoyltransferase complex dimerization subunit type 1 TsaB [Ginsengibacter sp.]
MNNQYLLNIHTTGETAIINLSLKDSVLDTKINTEFKDHAKFLHVAADALLKENNMRPADLSAIGVTHGPGSYTGIRVGLSAAKGLCYALKIPLITLSTLEVLTVSAIEKTNDSLSLYCPMIDARRMEVYTSLFDYELNKLINPHAVIVDSNFMEEFAKMNNIIFFGDGSAKFKEIIQERPNYAFLESDTISESLSKLSYKKFISSDFSDLAYSVPDYLKEFISTTKKRIL